MPKTRARFSAPVLLVVLVLPLAGCETTNDPLASILASPGQYDLYDCPAIKTAAVGVAYRQRELEGLMARADRGPAGGLVNATAYQPEYVTLRGKMDQLRQAAVTNKCNFVPGAAPTAGLPPPTARVQPPPPARNRSPGREVR